MAKYYVYTGKGSKIYTFRILKLAKAKAKRLSRLKSSGYEAYVTSNNLNNVIKSYYNEK